ncbi:hypothetical protein B0H13DRAFT_1881521 [Mycena leptocephala]|nr:hypothetical protein B0H13DRAFT_1881521 [Mycena leptocephala]
MKLLFVPRFSYSISKPLPRKHSYFLLAFGILSTAAFATINVFLVAGGLPAGAGFLYANQALTACDVDQFEITVKPGDRLLMATATILCPPPLTFRAVTSWSYSNHAMIGSRAVSAFPLNSLARATTDGMRNIMGEAYEDISNRLYVTNGTTHPSQQIYKVIAQGKPNCDPSPPFQCVIPPFTSYNAIGNIDLNILGATDVAADEGNLYNVINVFYSGVRLDLGHWTADNLFTNTTSFRQLVRVTSSANPAFRAVATTQGMAYANSTDPPTPDVPTPPAVIQIPYTCSIMQRKPIGSFAINILSATLSMFLGTWGIIIAILSFIVSKNPGANSCESHSQSLLPANREKQVDSWLTSVPHDPQRVKMLEESCTNSIY